MIGETDHIDAMLAARHHRSALWAAACRGEISTAQLYEGLLALRAQWGNALYDRPSRR